MKVECLHFKGKIRANDIELMAEKGDADDEWISEVYYREWSLCECGKDENSWV